MTAETNDAGIALMQAMRHKPHRPGSNIRAALLLAFSLALMAAGFNVGVAL